MYRQGDILLIPVATLPRDVIESDGNTADRIVIALGETTGHAHVAVANAVWAYWEVNNAEPSYLRVLPGEIAELRHEEHSTLHIPEGLYRVARQREYLPTRTRLVLD